MLRDNTENQIEEIIDYTCQNFMKIWRGSFRRRMILNWEDVDDDSTKGLGWQFNQIVQLQARVKTLENTLEYLTRSPALSDGR